MRNFGKINEIDKHLNMFSPIILTRSLSSIKFRSLMINFFLCDVLLATKTTLRDFWVNAYNA